MGEQLIRLTLLSEGSSDQMLLHPIRWVLETFTAVSYTDVFADDLPSGLTLGQKIRYVEQFFPCEILVVHRDADAAGDDFRRKEIELAQLSTAQVVVAAIPVRATEAWFIFSEAAIRRACGRPNGRIALPMPSIDEARRMADPKAKLFELIQLASERRGRAWAKFDRYHARHRVAELIPDYTQLLQNPEFAAFKVRLISAVAAI